MHTIPDDLKMDSEDLNNESVFKKKIDKIFAFLIDREASAQELASTAYGYYWALIGAAFGEKNVTSHGMTVTYLTKYINQYCKEKQKRKIVKDIDKTVIALNRMEEKGKTLSKLQKDWLKDITSAKEKIKLY